MVSHLRCVIIFVGFGLEISGVVMVFGDFYEVCNFFSWVLG